jgi:hypothetical protein
MPDYALYGSNVNLCLEMCSHTWYDSLYRSKSFGLKYNLSEGTAANARDVALMADVIDGVGSEINYW